MHRGIRGAGAIGGFQAATVEHAAHGALRARLPGAAPGTAIVGIDLGAAIPRHARRKDKTLRAATLAAPALVTSGTGTGAVTVSVVRRQA